MTTDLNPETVASGPDTALVADLTTHHIEGIAAHGNTPFRVPLYSQLNDTLWMGGCPPDAGAPEFDTIVCLYPWEPYQLADHQVFVQAKLFDGTEVPDIRRLVQLAGAVTTAATVGKTLVHCQAGLNRSGLVAALALMLSGATAVEAIDVLRAARSPAVLCNPHFENFLLRLHDYGGISRALQG